MKYRRPEARILRGCFWALVPALTACTGPREERPRPEANASTSSAEPLGDDAVLAGLGRIYAAHLSGGHVSEHDPVEARWVGDFVEAGGGGLRGGTGIAFGPDGDLYVGSSATHQVLRFDGSTGEFEGAFVDGGALQTPFSLVFGPGGDLFVSSGSQHRVLRFDGDSGAFEGVVLDGLQVPIGLRFGPDGFLYVANAGADEVLRTVPGSGEVEVFVAGGLDFPSDIVFSPSGELYVSSAITREVVRFDGHTGERRGVLLTLEEGSAPVGLDFALDGDLIVADFAGSRLLKVDAESGEIRQVFREGLDGPENVVVRRER